MTDIQAGGRPLREILQCDPNKSIDIPPHPSWDVEIPDMPWRRLEYHHLHVPPGSKSLTGFLKTLVPYEDTDSNLRHLLRALRRSELLHRWVDTRMPVVEDLGLPSTKVTIHHPHDEHDDWYHDTWESYTNWLSLVHIDSLIKPVGERFDYYKPFLWNVKPLYHIEEVPAEWIKRMKIREMNRAPAVTNPEMAHFQEYRHYNHDPAFAWVYEWRKSLWATVEELYAVDRFFSLQGMMLPEYHSRINQMARLYVPPIVRVLNEMISTEEDFEAALMQSHIEDEHMDKRLFAPAAAEVCEWPNLSPMLDHITILDCLHDFLRSTLRPILLEMRDCFEYRMVRDWAHGRPWKKINTLLSEERLGEGVQDAVDMVRAELRRSKRASNLFDVHPALVSKEPFVEHENNNNNFCGVCWIAWGDQDLVMELWCNHYYHAACLYGIWDDPHRFSFGCAVCRQSAPKHTSRFPVADAGPPQHLDPDHFDVPYAAALEAQTTMVRRDLRRAIRERASIDEIADDPDLLFAFWGIQLARMHNARRRDERSEDLGVIPRPAKQKPDEAFIVNDYKSIGSRDTNQSELEQQQQQEQQNQQDGSSDGDDDHDDNNDFDGGDGDGDGGGGIVNNNQPAKSPLPPHQFAADAHQQPQFFPPIPAPAVETPDEDSGEDEIL